MRAYKRKIILFCVFNLFLSLILMFGSIFLASLTMNDFERPGTKTPFETWLLDLGSLSGRYFLAFALVIPRKFISSSLGGVMSYVSAFIMTMPFTFLGFLLWKLARRGKSSNMEQDPSSKS